ncbi:MAG: ABC transporter permease [Alistipes sp.]|nr:ABC transporter permease [Alistipes sp.]
MRNIGLIIMREFKERVYKKSFIITTLLMPVLMLVLSIAPTLIMFFAKGETKHISVIDQSGIVADKLESNEDVVFEVVPNGDLQTELKRSLEQENFGVLYIEQDVVTNPNKVQLYTNASSSMTIEDSIADQIEDIVETERLKAHNIENLPEILKQIEVNISLTTYRNGDNEQSEATSSAASSFAGIALGFVLYFFLIIYGSIVMQSIIEEKNSRILEVLVSTVRPFDMMMGKILGVASVALTQIAIWGVLLIVISAAVIPAVIPQDVLAGVEAVQAGADVATLTADIDPEAITALASIMDTGYISELVVLLLLFMMGGFLLYAAMYAAIGASVDQVQDAQQLTTPVTIPIIFSFIILTMIMNDPNNPLVVWCSIIPFTSPIVMIGRIPSGIPTWEIVTSLILLYATFIVMVWLAGKIYRVGIFMHGKKPSLKELYRWLKY